MLLDFVLIARLDTNVPPRMFHQSSACQESTKILLARRLARIAAKLLLTVEPTILCSEPQHVKCAQLGLNAQVNQLCQSNALMVNFQQQVLQVVEIVIIARVMFAKMEVFKVTRLNQF
jgi:hypothetical protein